MSSHSTSKTQTGPHKDRSTRTHTDTFPNRLGASHSTVCLSRLRHHSRFISLRGVDLGSRTHYHTHIRSAKYHSDIYTDSQKNVKIHTETQKQIQYTYR